MALGSFTAQLGAFEKKAGLSVKVACQKIAMEAWKRVILKSPVDTGRFRANWGCQIGSPYSGTSDSFDKAGGQTIGKAVIVTAGWSGKESIFLVNNVVYSIPLEYGHSLQAPGGMVRLTVAEMKNGIAEQIAKGTT